MNGSLGALRPALPCSRGCRASSKIGCFQGVHQCQHTGACAPKPKRHVRGSRTNGALAKNKGKTTYVVAEWQDRPPCAKGWMYIEDVHEMNRRIRAQSKKIRWAKSVEFISGDLEPGLNPQRKGMSWDHFCIMASLDVRKRQQFEAASKACAKAAKLADEVAALAGHVDER